MVFQSNTFLDLFPPVMTSHEPEWLEKASIDERVTCRVTITENYVRKEDTGFGAYNVEDEKEEGKYFSLSGVFSEFLAVGQTYAIKGVVQEFRGEKQVRGFEARAVQPRSRHAVISYLQTLHGLKTRAEIIYDAYGSEAIDILLHTPERVAKEIDGVGMKSVARWQEQLQEMQMNSEMTLALLDMGLTSNQIRRLLDVHGNDTLNIIKRNPYVLSRTIEGYGFKRCDDIALRTGTDLKGLDRLSAGVLHVLSEAEREGHCFLMLSDAMKEAAKLLQVELPLAGAQKLAERFRQTEQDVLPYQVGQHEIPFTREAIQDTLSQREYFPPVILTVTGDLLAPAVQALVSQGSVVLAEDRLYLRSLYRAERRASQNVMRLTEETQHHYDVKHVIDSYLKGKDIQLEERQREAVERFTKSASGVHILNGAAGCGKTFVLNIILDIMEKLSPRRLEIEIMAPTGRAAKVVAMATGRESKTIHRALQYMQGLGFTRNEEDPLTADVIVVDEFSMVDIHLFDSLLSAIKNKRKVIFIGDHKQLPSVGPGRILKDLLDHGGIDCVTLNVIKRQGVESGIALNSEQILNGSVPVTREKTADAYVLPVNSMPQMHGYLLSSFKRLLELGYSMEESQILLPMKAGEAGVDVINLLIQQHFNPIQKGEETFLNKRVKRRDQRGDREDELHFHKGDKVIHLKNNYGAVWHKKTGEETYAEMEDQGIMNGEIGVIESVKVIPAAFNKKEKEIWVRYDDIYIRYINDFEELDHAYAVTIHKSQGSQWLACILVLMMSHYRMLENEIFYTGYSRARSFQVTIAEEQAMRRAVTTFSSKERNTYLKENLTRLTASLS